MSKFSKFLNHQFKYFGFQIKKYQAPNYRWLTNNNINTIIDIGANTGQFAVIYGKVLPNAKIYSFEPIKHCFNLLKQNTNSLNIECFNIGLGEIVEDKTINIYNHSPSSSFLGMTTLHEDLFPHSKGHKEELTKVERLDNIFTNKFIEENIFVKIDVQGFEINVIKGGKEFLKKAKIILIEMSFSKLYIGQSLFDEVYLELHHLGFRFKGNLSQTIDPNNGSIIYSDSIFIKE